MIVFDMPDAPTIDPPIEPARVDEIKPRHNIRIDTMFWQHRSIFAGNQEQLNQLRREADARAAARARQSIYDVHRPAIRRLKPIVHVGFIPLLWAITTCKCGQRWPCNDIKQYLRRRLGWTVDITQPLNDLTQRLPKPTTRWKRLRQTLTRSRRSRDEPGSRRKRDT